MRVNTLTRASIASVLVVLLVLGVPAVGNAAPVSTSQALALESEGQARAIVDAYLGREQVADELAALGVDPELARLRAMALSPSELDELVGRIEDSPAGGSGVITVLGVTFLVLLILELVGVIDIFKKL